MPTLQLRRTSLFWFQGAFELGRVFGGRVVLFLFVYLFVCFFQLLRWVIILFFKSHKWVRFSCFFVLFCFVLFLFCFVLFFLQNVQFPHHNLGSGWFFFFFFFFLSRRLIKFFAFFYFCSFVCLYFILVFVLFCFFVASKNSVFLDIKWCALILILLHRWWWT